MKAAAALALLGASCLDPGYLAGDAWLATPTAGALLARSSHTMVWTGSEVIVWGGADWASIATNTGARYCP